VMVRNGEIVAIVQVKGSCMLPTSDHGEHIPYTESVCFCCQRALPFHAIELLEIWNNSIAYRRTTIPGSCIEATSILMVTTERVRKPCMFPKKSHTTLSVLLFCNVFRTSTVLLTRLKWNFPRHQSALLDLILTNKLGNPRLQQALFMRAVKPVRCRAKFKFSNKRKIF
jgi:hypothetical protein